LKLETSDLKSEISECMRTPTGGRESTDFAEHGGAKPVQDPMSKVFPRKGVEISLKPGG
jgi:hypothetical protein